MAEQAFLVANYEVLGLAIMYSTLVSMRDVYVPKRSLALGIAYYAVKFFVDYFFYSMLPGMPDGWRLLGFTWGMLILALSFPFCKLLFWGGMAELYACFAAVNAILSIMQLTSFYMANLLLGKPLSAGFQESYGPGTFLSIAIFTVEYLCLRRPLTWMMRGLQRFPYRYQVLLAEMGFLATSGFIASVYLAPQATSASDVPLTYWAIVICTLLPLFVITGLQVMLSTRARAQIAYMRHIEELTRSYRERIHAQLAIAERDRALFDGLDVSLERLGEQSGSPELVQRIARLEEQYDRIARGTYCNNPIHDAFLCAEAGRLAELGVQPCFSVAALSPSTDMSPQLMLILLSEVDRLALRARQVAGSEVNLRVRSINDMMHLSLDLPSSWGRIRAKRLLEDSGFGDDVLVSEKVEGARTEVIVFDQKEGSSSSS